MGRLVQAVATDLAGVRLSAAARHRHRRSGHGVRGISRLSFRGGILAAHPGGVRRPVAPHAQCGRSAHRKHHRRFAGSRAFAVVVAGTVRGVQGACLAGGQADRRRGDRALCPRWSADREHTPRASMPPCPNAPNSTSSAGRSRPAARRCRACSAQWSTGNRSSRSPCRCASAAKSVTRSTSDCRPGTCHR